LDGERIVLTKSRTPLQPVPLEVNGTDLAGRTIEGRMRLKFLGTGTAWSKAPVNYNNNVLVEAGEGSGGWLIDCGTTAPQALHQLGMSVADFEGVLLTHLHGDHVFGLEETGFFNFFTLNRRVKLWLPEQLLSSRSGIEGEDIWENCLRGPMGTVQMKDGSPQEVGLGDYFDITFLRADEPTEIEGVHVELFEVAHVPNKPSFGLILEGNVGYTSDCRFSQDRIEWLLDRGVVTLYHDVFFGPAFPGRVHTAYVELATIPREMAEHIVLMHYNDDVTNDELEAARQAGFRVAERAVSYDY